MKLARSKKAILVTIVLGIFTFGYRLTNYMICSDSTNYFDTISPSWVTSLGRYLLPVVEKVRGTHELTWLIGMISIIFIGFTAALLVEIFDINGNIGIVAISWLLVASPVVTSIFAFMYTADGYMVSLFFSVLTVYLVNRYPSKKGVLLGSLSLFISLGFYQAFVTTTMLTMILYIITMLLDSSKTYKDVFRRCLAYLITGILGVLLYGIILALVWKLGGYGTTTYMGVNEANSGILSSFAECYIDFARFFVVRWQVNVYNVMNVVMFLVIGILLVLFAIRNRTKGYLGRVALTILLLMLLPVFAFCFEFVSSGVSYTSTSMEYCVTIVFIYPIVLWARLGMDRDFAKCTIKELQSNWLYFGTGFLMLMIAFHCTVIANCAAYNMDDANTKLEMLINRIETRMELLPGYSEDKEVAIYGSKYEIPEYVYAAPMMSGVVSKIFLTNANEYVSVMNKYLSTDYKCASEERLKALGAMEEFPIDKEWPADGSVVMIDDTIVVILSDIDFDIYVPNMDVQ